MRKLFYVLLALTLMACDGITENPFSQITITSDLTDGPITSGVTGSPVIVPPAETTLECIDQWPHGDGIGWNGEMECVLPVQYAPESVVIPEYIGTPTYVVTTQEQSLDHIAHWMMKDLYCEDHWSGEIFQMFFTRNGEVYHSKLYEQNVTGYTYNTTFFWEVNEDGFILDLGYGEEQWYPRGSQITTNWSAGKGQRYCTFRT